MNCLLYLITLCLCLGYFSQTKYTSKFVYYMFQGFFIIRPILILLYALVTIGTEMQRRSSKLYKKSSKKSSQDREVSDSMEPSEDDY